MTKKKYLNNYYPKENDKKIILRKKYAELSREEKINNILLLKN